MSAVLFAPHNDDETLFAFFQMVRYRPHVVVVLRSCKKGPSYAVRESETRSVVCDLLDLTYEQWPYPDVATPWPEIALEIAAVASKYDHVIAPAWEPCGHEHHNAVATAVSDHGNVTRYHTYQRGCGRTMSEREIATTNDEREAKLAALRCYRSQATHPPTAPWFPGGALFDICEWEA